MADETRIELDIDTEDLVACLGEVDGAGAFRIQDSLPGGFLPEEWDIEDVCLFNPTADAKAQVHLVLVRVAQDRDAESTPEPLCDQ